ncbi:CST complex subunit TEN1 isoform X3 [Coffea eugenioides]|uniref:CST complex subunit TEN1 isoform X3 n=1 Tax=Coffea eugenioides TaxID=49369 RepID=UPI000F611B01|nr:CST complex subunit TEN1 isoform X3 [Coffea eugenioides]
MATSAVSFGALVTLEELVPSSPQFTQGASLRVTGKLQEYDIETAIASIVEGNASLKIDTQHLKVNLHIGSLYQFIGELLIDPSNQIFSWVRYLDLQCQVGTRRAFQS